MASTLAVFRNVVQEFGKAGGVSYISMVSNDPTEIDRTILRGLQSFTRYTYGLYDTDFTFTTAASSHTYSTSGMFHIDNITVGDIVLRNWDGGQGPESKNRFFMKHPTWRTDPLNKPHKYVLLPQNQIMLYPVPDAAYTVYMAGYVEHPVFTLGTAGTGITLSIEDHVLDIAAMWCSMLFKYPHMEGETLFQQIVAMDQITAQKLQDYRDHNLGITFGYAKRGGDGPRYFL